MTARRTIPTALATVLAASLCLVAAPEDASALDLQAGVGGRVGAATIQPPGDNVDSNTGFGGGARVWAALKFIDFLAVGLNFDFAGSSHSDDAGGIDVTTSVIVPSVGGIIRSDVADMIAIDFWINYAFGSSTTEAGGAETSADLTGLHLGVDAYYRIKIPAFKTWIEVGPYFSYGSLENPDVPDGVDIDPTSYLGYGLAVQGTFEFGL